MSFEKPTTSTKPVRSVWARSLTLALGLHLAVAAAMLVSNGASVDHLSSSNLAPIVESQLIKPTTPIDASFAPIDATVTTPTSPQPPSNGSVSLAVEPPAQVVHNLAQTILSKAAQPAGPDSLKELRRQAATLSQISTPHEVARISQEVCKALGASRKTTPQPGADFDFNQSLVEDSQRIEQVNTIEIREKLTDPSGEFVTIVYRRTSNPEIDQITYTQGIIEGTAIEPVWSNSDQEAFEAAEARQRPFAVINQFPLVRQIHDQAVLPLLQKLSKPNE